MARKHFEHSSKLKKAFAFFDLGKIPSRFLASEIETSNRNLK